MLLYAQFKQLTLVTKVFALVAAAAGAITGSVAAWPLVRVAVPAPIGFVEAEINHRVGRVHDDLVHQVMDVRNSVNQILIWKFEDSRNRVHNDANSWGIQLNKEQDPHQRELIQRQINSLKRQEQQYDEQIKQLTK